jgi:sporulation protein YlmC with PRC-barrel domain
MKPIALFTMTGLLLASTAPVFAQSSTAPAPIVNSGTTTQGPGEIRADKLIGRNIQNPQNETIGEIKSVMLDQSGGKVDTVIVGVGGFLGIGEREVAIGWKDLNISENGEKVTTALTKDQLKAMPEYKYADAKQRGTVFGVPATNTNTAAAPRTTTTTTAPANTATATAPAAGYVGASKLVGLNVRNAQGESIGEIKEVLIGNNGAIQSAIVGVGGFLGVGERNVALAWNQLKLQRDSDQLKAMVNMTKDELKTMPEYQEQKGAWAVK